ncbi:MAG: hypothetical protein ABIG88_00955 [Patescibacteria group bacterium]|nr:hypothetical protein [Patescibacteria group bacterium]
MPEIQDKYKEPLEGDPIALSEKVELREDKPDPREQEILELERKLAEKKQELELQPTPEVLASEAEVIKEEPKEPEKLVEKEVVPPTSKLSSKVKDQIKKLKELDRENQIKELCNLSFSEDLDFAVNVAKGLDDAYVLDEFHDALVDELYDKLVEQGELKKI